CPKPGNQYMFTTVEVYTRQKLACHGRTLLLLDRFRRESGNVVNVDVLQTVTQGRVQVCVDWFACLDRKSVIPLVIIRTQVVGLRKKKLATQGQLAIEEIGFGQCEDEILAFRAILDTQSKLLTSAGESRPVH